jgi:tripartite-type tricarboxylate transporter receptor subunit TctC
MRYHQKLVLGVFALLTAFSSAWAQQYPDRAVKWIVPYPPAGTTDVIARIIAPPLSEILGQQVIVENRPGGGNNIGVDAVVKSPPDGYTMLLVNPANGINTTLYKSLPFNFIRDIAPVAGIIRSPNVMVVPPSFPANNVAEFLAYCKNNVSKINMASSGSGTSVHMSGELFKSMTGCNMQVLFDNLPSSAGHIKSGRLKALAVTSEKREPSLPNIQTVGETIPGYEATAWFGVGMPRGTPPDIVNKMNAAINKVMSNPKIRERLAELGGVPITGTPADFGKVIQAETDKWAKVVKFSGATAE